MIKKKVEKVIKQIFDFCKLLNAMHCPLWSWLCPQSFLAFFFASILNQILASQSQPFRPIFATLTTRNSLRCSVLIPRWSFWLTNFLDLFPLSTILRALP